MGVGRIATRATLVLAVLVGADWLLARAVLGDGRFLGRPIAPFDPPLFSSSQRAGLEHIEAELAGSQPKTGKFDADLGWCNPPRSGFGAFTYDWSGARIGAAPLARAKVPGQRRVVAVGCSMTHGEEVGATEAWCARVDALLEDLEVANLGVAAYGIDQALLRLRRDGWPLEPDEVWLGILPQAALRMSTLFRPLLDHWSLDVAFKPRFLLDPAGELELVPNPARSLAEAASLLRDQQRFVAALGQHDPWVARARLAYAPRGSSWTHASFTARLMLTLQERSGRDFEACFDERSEFGRLYSAIVRTMARECVARGARLRVLVLPGPSDLEQLREAGRGYWEDWLARLQAEGTSVLDLAPRLSQAQAEGRQLFEPGGHYTPEAGELVARALRDELAR
jgi:hypothetical protein